MPVNFCKDVFVEYQIYLDDKKYRTPVVQGKNRNPSFNCRIQHTREVVTDEFLNYLMTQNINFKLFGFPDVAKKEAAPTQRKQAKRPIGAAASSKQV